MIYIISYPELRLIIAVNDKAGLPVKNITKTTGFSRPEERKLSLKGVF
jgi:hypothetical protein